mgnify:CR=1 FL=1
MKKSVRVLCLMLTLSLLMAFPVHAESNAEPRGSAFFSSYWTFLHKTSSTSFEVWFDVESNAAVMQEIGASMVEVYESPNGENDWTKVKTYEKADYPSMIDYNTGSHTSYVTYSNAISGRYYTACVTYYAKNSTGIGERFIYTEIMQM